MYHGFREVCAGFTKNIAYAFNGWLGAVLFFLTAAWFVMALAPPLFLLLALAGVPIARATSRSPARAPPCRCSRA
jgi:hypothetical protein